MNSTPTDSEEGFVLLTPGWNGLREPVLLQNPTRILSTSSLHEVAPLLAEAGAEAGAGRVVAGFVSYEAGAAFESAVPFRNPDLPLLWMAVYDRFPPGAGTASRGAGTVLGGAATIRNPAFSFSPDEYRSQLLAVKRHIHEGDVYQINLTGHFHFGVAGRARDLFDELVRRQPIPYGAYIDTGETQILSLSPELFFIKRDDYIVARPMKGTAPRGASPDEDRRLEAWLSEDEKSRAENLMIVDLLRNDLSRVCRPGSVRVPSLFATERYETLIQMTSEVEGRLLPETGMADIFRALFPCGSVTGAPKIRAMQLIHHLESSPRGAYCGAIGFMRGDTAIFNVAIRTVTVTGDRGVLGVGSGIVWDSDPAAEYDECLLKASFLTSLQDFKLIETMRWEGGAIDLLDLHLERLERSAKYFGFSFRRDAIGRRIDELTSRLQGESRKVRLTLTQRGEVEITVSTIQGPRGEWKVKIAGTAIDASDVFRRHKTTRRDLYEEEFRAGASAGFDEVLFLNTRGELAEGSRTNVIIARGDEWFTPPPGSGALRGVFREHLLRSRANLRERVLYIDDLAEASDVYLCNAVVGLVRARVVSEPAPVAGR